jgi:hypothetical protein
MPLINCPACGHAISTEAEACPQCGHPNHPARHEPADLTCYACARPATTRCQSCGALSCAEHLQSIYVPHGRGGAYELRCNSCYSSASAWKAVSYVIAAIVLIIVLVFLFGMMGR